MYKPPTLQSSTQGNAIRHHLTPDLDDTSISLIEDTDVDVDVDVDTVEVDVDLVPTKKPHFLDYDAAPPPPDIIERFGALKLSNHAVRSNGERVRVDKKYERDGEISDYELAAGGYTKKEFTQDDNTLELDAVAKKSCKHFLDENPVPPDGMVAEDKLHEKRHTEQLSIVGRLRLPSERYNDAAPLIHLPKGLSAGTHAFETCYSNGLEADKLDMLGPKVECVYSLLSMLGSNDPLEMAKKFHELSRSTETCNTLRRSGCISLLIQMIYAEGCSDDVRKWAGMALHNVVHSHPDEKAGRREAKVLRLLDQIMDYCNFLRTLLQSGGETIADDADRHPLAAMSSLMKVSFDEEHRHAMCELGALHAIPNLVYLDHAAHGPKPETQCCNSLRRFALMALTNLTFGDENNKALLCSQKTFMEALVTQLDSTPDDLLQVTASVLRNLSWRADTQMKAVLNEIGTVTALANAAMKNKCENTLKAILSALWNLSAHCSMNKAEFCAVDGALSFIVKMLSYEALKIVENAGGILRNVSSHIAVREDYRQILRDHNCLTILLQQLKSESLTVVSNSCGTLWNLSARCPQDQRFLWDNGAVPMLRSLIHSKHAMIAEGSACALKNLLNFRPSAQNVHQMDPIARSLNLKKLPTLNVRKQKALEQELGVTVKSHTETCDNLDTGMTKERPTYNATAAVSSTKQRPRYPLPGTLGVIPVISGRLTRSAMLIKSESRDSIFSVKSDSAAYDHLMRSHSATDTNRKLQHIAEPTVADFTLKSDIEAADDQLIDYAAKYKESGSKQEETKIKPPSINESSYQETDLDQPTDFSLRYAENQVENDMDLAIAAATQGEHVKSVALNEPLSKPSTGTTSENEIILILDDSVKCYQTEDTPYVISNAPSITDLRSAECAKKIPDDHHISSIMNRKTVVPSDAQGINQNVKKCSKHYPQAISYGSAGSYTPEKPVNYCEEGTPGYFSRYESLSSLDEAGHNLKKDAVSPAREEEKNILVFPNSETDEEKSQVEVQVQVAQPNQINSALETPLMYSRHSSMDSLAGEDVEPIDDKSSVVSEFSRLASGVISPSELPDSPTQSMPHSPRRNNDSGGVTANVYHFTARTSPTMQQSQTIQSKRCLRSVFEDDLNTFHVENTPAQFSTATSLSNLSILDEESSPSQLPNGGNYHKQQQQAQVNGVISENEEEEEDDDGHAKSDDLILATCINMGMKRAVVHPAAHQDTKDSSINQESAQDIPKRYCTEDTPAALSKVCSNTNLSTVSIYSNNNEDRDSVGYKMMGEEESRATAERRLHVPSARHSLNLSDDMSSNASESGAACHNFDILQQCIRDGMQKSINKDANRHNVAKSHPACMDPIAKMRKGGLPPYLQTNDEINKYHTEDSPCNFSVASGLSNLTVGSSLVGPAVKLNNNNGEKGDSKALEDDNKIPLNVDIVGKETTHYWQDDSLSSLSIESEDDSNLLSQAIAAGCNRPKSNLGFSTTITSSGRHRTTTPAVPRPVPIMFSSNAPALKQWQQHSRQYDCTSKHDNESDSSTTSSDSNDNQSKSLFELCILTGMHKTQEESRRYHNNDTGQQRTRGITSSHKNKLVSASTRCNNERNTTRSNPDLKQYDALRIEEKFMTPNRHLLEQEKRDEKLLMECINTGIMKKIGESRRQHQASVLIRDTVLTPFNGQSKNGQATSAAVQMNEASHHTTIQTDASAIPTALAFDTNTITTIAAPDVEKNSGDIANIQHEMINNNQHKQPQQLKINNYVDVADGQKSCSHLQNPQTHPERDISPQNHENLHETTTATRWHTELGAVSSTAESQQSLVMESISIDGRCTDSNSSNSYKMAADKHKNPDLMLKSVERLTMEFVSSAEQSRLNSGLCGGDSEEIAAVVKNCLKKDVESTTATNSTNTWNDETCPNNVSFPSVSVTAPKVASLNYDDDENEDDQATTADCKELNDYENVQPLPLAEISQQDFFHYNQEEYDFCLNNATQPNSLDTATKSENTLITNEEKDVEEDLSNGINFEVGGKVQTAATTSSSLHFHSTAMCNSIFLGQEARKLAENFQTHNNNDDEITVSLNSIDLDNVRPPSGMNSLNISGCYQEVTMNISAPNDMNELNFQQKPSNHQQLMTKSSHFPKKPIPIGLVARRALGHLPSFAAGSAESIVSSCNIMLDNIKPPSLMDELLDSMVSVASIESEIAEDCASMATTVTVSNYETANGNDDNTNHLLENCCDNDNTLNENSANTTPLPSECDYSSADSTPQRSSNIKANNSLTPKQKRKLTKERFKTYTIVDDELLSINVNSSLEDQTVPDETLSIEIKNMPDLEENETELQISQQNKPKWRRRSSQDRYKTQTIVFPSIIKQNSANSDDILKNTLDGMKNENISDVDRENVESNLNSLECDQNSETESSHDLNVGGYQTDEDLKNKQQSVQRVATAKGRIHRTEDKYLEKERIEMVEKTTRGLKKSQYISPYSKQYQRSVQQSNTSTSTNRSQQPVNFKGSNNNFNVKSKLYNATAAVKAVKENVMAATSIPHKNKMSLKNNKSVTGIKEQPPLRRQSTFVKDKPETMDPTAIPIVETTSPNALSPSKLPTKRQTTSLSNLYNKAAPTNTTRKFIISAANRRLPGGGGGGGGMNNGPQRANSNVTIRPMANATRSAVLATRISTTTPPTRSNSSMSSATAAVAAQNAAAKINQAQSRMANIWHKTNENSNRKNVTNKSTKSAVKSNNTTNGSHLRRSSTFDNNKALQVQSKVMTKNVNGKMSASSSSTKIAGTKRPVTVTSRK